MQTSFRTYDVRKTGEKEGRLLSLLLCLEAGLLFTGLLVGLNLAGLLLCGGLRLLRLLGYMGGVVACLIVSVVRLSAPLTRRNLEGENDKLFVTLRVYAGQGDFV